MIVKRIARPSSLHRVVVDRYYSNVKFPELAVGQQKPRIRDFKNPLFHTFLIASSTYIILHTIWIILEYQEEEKRLKEKSKELENKIQLLVDERSSELKARRSWYNYIKFWK